MDAEQFKAVMDQMAATLKAQQDQQEQQRAALNTLATAVQAIQTGGGGGNGNGNNNAPKPRQWQMLSIFVKTVLDLDDQDAEKFQSWRESFESFMKNGNFRPENQAALETAIKNGTENAVNARNAANEAFFDDQLAAMTSMCSDATKQKIRAIRENLPDTVNGRKSIDVILDRIATMAGAQSTIWSSRVDFRTREQHVGESFATFVEDLKFKVTKCGYRQLFEDHANQEIYMQNRLLEEAVVGCNDKVVRNMMFREGDNLTLDKAIEIAKIHESIEKTEQDFDSKHKGHANAIKSHAEDDDLKGKCRRCGKKWEKGHMDKCYAKDKECLGCGKMGHIVKVCKSKGKDGEKKKGSKKGKFEKKADSETKAHSKFLLTRVGELEDLYHIPVTVKFQNEDVEVPAMLDTGSNFDCIPKSHLRKIGAQVENLQESLPWMRQVEHAGGGSLQCLGFINTKIGYEKDEVNVKLVVFKELCSMIIGKTTCRKLGLLMPSKKVEKKLIPQEKLKVWRLSVANDPKKS